MQALSTCFIVYAKKKLKNEVNNKNTQFKKMTKKKANWD